MDSFFRRPSRLSAVFCSDAGARRLLDTRQQRLYAGPGRCPALCQCAGRLLGSGHRAPMSAAPASLADRCQATIAAWRPPAGNAASPRSNSPPAPDRAAPSARQHCLRIGDVERGTVPVRAEAAADGAEQGDAMRGQMRLQRRRIKRRDAQTDVIHVAPFAPGAAPLFAQRPIERIKSISALPARRCVSPSLSCTFSMRQPSTRHKKFCHARHIAHPQHDVIDSKDGDRWWRRHDVSLACFGRSSRSAEGARMSALRDDHHGRGIADAIRPLPGRGPQQARALVGDDHRRLHRVGDIVDRPRGSRPRAPACPARGRADRCRWPARADSNRRPAAARTRSALSRGEISPSQIPRKASRFCTPRSVDLEPAQIDAVAPAQLARHGKDPTLLAGGLERAGAIDFLARDVHRRTERPRVLDGARHRRLVVEDVRHRDGRHSSERPPECRSITASTCRQDEVGHVEGQDAKTALVVARKSAVDVAPIDGRGTGSRQAGCRSDAPGG